MSSNVNRNLMTVPPQVPRPERPPRVASPAVERLRHSLKTGLTSLDTFWKEIGEQGLPLVEDCGDPALRVVTFLWRGGDELADVILVANKIADPHSYEQNRMERLPGTDVWHMSYRMGSDWRASYAVAPLPADGSPPTAAPDVMVEVRRSRALAAAAPADRDAVARWFDALRHARPDPMGRERLDERWSVASLPDAPPQPWLAPRPGTPAGTVREYPLTSAVLGNTRPVWVHEPAERPAGGAPWPVLVLLDGDDWHALPVAPLLDRMTAAGALPPTLCVMVPALDFATRTRELACDDSFTAFLTDELLPWLGGEYAITGDPDRTVIAGQSLGGLTALYAAHRAPGRFGRVLAQSGSFWWPNPVGAGGETERLAGLLADSGALPSRVHLSVGLHEWTLLEPSRRIRDVLLRRGVDLDYVEFNGGHDRACWRAGLPGALLSLTRDRPRGLQARP
ncbi:enterochelin esterase [Actinorugispora endophytica]|nr:enterochelin esterase [Actinorugispora endophytica]